MLRGSVSDRPHRFLDRAILRPEAFHAGIRLAAGLHDAVDQIIVCSIAYRMIRTRDIFRMNPKPGFRTSDIFFRQRSRRMEIDAIEHCILIVDWSPYMRGVRKRRDDFVEWHQQYIHIPHDGSIAAIAAGSDDESEIRWNNFIMRRNDAAAGVALGTV